MSTRQSDHIKNEPKVAAWIRDVEQAGSTVKSIKALQEIRKTDDELLFALLDTEVISPEGTRIPRIVFIRGHACVIVPLLHNRDTGEEKFLMVRQRRIGNGQLSLEFPAGMLDTESDAVAVAVKELREETGLDVSSGDLFPLFDRMLYSSAGACDEAIYYFGCISELDNASFCSFINRQGGNPEEEEHISVALMTRELAETEATSLQVHLGFFLFEHYQQRRRAGENP